jgi:hypothetical protein
MQSVLSAARASNRSRPARPAPRRTPAVPDFPVSPNVDTLPAWGLDEFFRPSANLGSGARRNLLMTDGSVRFVTNSITAR